MTTTAPAPVADLAATGARPVALVVEDDDDVAALLASHLARLGWTCHRAATGEDGVALASSVVPRLALVDIGLPGMDGREVIRHLRDDGVTRECVVAVTTVLDGDDLEDVDFDVLLPKPFSRRDVERLLAGVPRGAQRPAPRVAGAGTVVVPPPAARAPIPGGRP